MYTVQSNSCCSAGEGVTREGLRMGWKYIVATWHGGVPKLGFFKKSVLCQISTTVLTILSYLINLKCEFILRSNVFISNSHGDFTGYM